MKQLPGIGGIRYLLNQKFNGIRFGMELYGIYGIPKVSLYLVRRDNNYQFESPFKRQDRTKYIMLNVLNGTAHYRINTHPYSDSEFIYEIFLNSNHFEDRDDDSLSFCLVHECYHLINQFNREDYFSIMAQEEIDADLFAINELDIDKNEYFAKCRKYKPTKITMKNSYFKRRIYNMAFINVCNLNDWDWNNEE